MVVYKAPDGKRRCSNVQSFKCKIKKRAPHELRLTGDVATHAPSAASVSFIFKRETRFGRHRCQGPISSLEHSSRRVFRGAIY